jgi:predicted RNA-binding protein YlxR (DUF448 family)
MAALDLHDARDSGARKIIPGSQRLCAATGEVRCVDDMIRFVVGPDQAVVPDLKRRLPGRGLWVTARRDAVALAVRRNCFARGFKRDVSAGSQLVEMTERLLERAALDALAIAHKAHRVAIGFARVEKALATERTVAVLHAREAAPDGLAKLAGVCGRREDAAEIAVIDGFASTQLDLALGRSNVIHAALRAGRESETFLARSARLHCFRTGSVAGLPAMDANGNPTLANAEQRHAPMEKAGDKMRLRELDRDWNGRNDGKD